MANFWNALSAAGTHGVPAFRQAQLFAQQQQQQRMDAEAEALRGTAMRGMTMPTPPPPGPQNMPSQGSLPMPQQAEMPGSQPMPQTMQRPGMTANMGTPEQAPVQPKIDWQTALTSISREHPGASPELIARAVDKLTPFMSAQAQQEWRQLQMGMQQQRLDAQVTNQAADNTRADKTLQLNEDKATANIDYRKERLKQFDAALAAKAPPMEHMAPAAKAKLQQLHTAYVQSQNNYRTAEIGLSYATNKIAAGKKVEEALRRSEVAADAYEAFVGSLQAPAAGAPAPRGGKPQAAAEETLAPIEQATLAPPEPKPQGPVVKGAPNNMGQPAAAAAQAFPLPQSKTMMVKDRLYDVKGTNYKWDGNNLVKVQSGKTK